jgi:hypothetical protein
MVYRFLGFENKMLLLFAKSVIFAHPFAKSNIMETKYFDEHVVKSIMDAQAHLDAQIQSLTVEKETFYVKLDQIALDALLKVNWKPRYNEKAVFVDFVTQDAWHVWFLEQEFRGKVSYYRFREVPNDFHAIFNYYTQWEYPDIENKTHSWILPVPIYKALKQIMKIHLYPDKHKTYGKP